MSLIRFTPKKLADRCLGRGVPVGAVEAAIARREGEYVFLDDQHEAYQPIRLGLGDRFAAVTKALHIPECGGCQGRRKWANDVGGSLGFG